MSEVDKNTTNFVLKNYPQFIEKYEDANEFLNSFELGLLEDLHDNTIIIFGFNKTTGNFDIACSFRQLKNLLLG